MDESKVMKKLWQSAERHLAGGVNSPVRAFKKVGGTPIFMDRGFGPFLIDAEGRRYIDYCLSWGAVLFGHAHEETAAAIQKQAVKGTSFGTVTENETLLAKAIQKAFPAMERVRFTSSGTEAAMSAIRLARGVTGRNRIVKFEGCYHGHADGLLVKAGSGAAAFGSPDSLGVPSEIAGLTAVLPYNDTEAVRSFFRRTEDTAAVIVEPVAGNMGVVPARQDFLEALREETERTGSLLILDEVITGFRVGYGGAGRLYEIRPDITLLGKIIGGGLPIGAFGGSAKIMNFLSPLGKVYQAGTLSGNPLSTAAGLSILSRLSRTFYEELHAKVEPFYKNVRLILKKKGRKAVLQNFGTMFTLFFRSQAPVNFREVSSCDSKRFARFFHRMLAAGIYLPPSPFESCFISASHTERELDKTLEALSKSLP